MKKLKLIALIFVTLSMSACKTTTKKQSNSPADVAKVARPDIVIYKTKADYSRLVPVILGPDKQKISSYPAVSDIRNAQKPLPLKNGFLLDRRGINEHAAFLNMSYEDYAQLPKTPGTDSLLSMIRDKDPFEVIYRCPQDKMPNNELKAFLNQIISDHVLDSLCTKVESD